MRISAISLAGLCGSLAVAIALSYRLSHLSAADVPAGTATADATTAADAKFSDVNDLPEHKEMPDPLIGADGNKITTPEQWKAHREK